MRNFVSEKEIRDRIELNFDHLMTDPYYGFNAIFSPADYSWHGDKEGRALLAFVSHYKISGRIIPCMPQMLAEMPNRLNEEGYFGPRFQGTILEEQISGHSWLLRGLCEHYRAFGDAYSFTALQRIVKNLYLPLKERIHSYPIERKTTASGGVCGKAIEEMDGWILSSDIGTTFMCIDGLSHAYEITKDLQIKELVDEMIAFFLSIDKVKLKAQTHCSLTAARGMLRMFQCTDDKYYFEGAEAIFKLYAFGGGMTKTYQNLNWWGRPDSWTEPCAIVDSLMVAIMLFKITKNEEYRVLAARIYHNGLATAQRDNGGAGTDTLICPNSPHKDLRPLKYEAFFCCSMRIAEGLWYINENKDLLWTEQTGKIQKGTDNIYSDNDMIYCLPDESLIPYAEGGRNVDGMTLYPIVKGYKVPKEIFMAGKQKIIFD